ncbi:MAG: hypothetical protein WCX46_01910, partial [Candidatus Paceibacterota bacterium]
MYISKKIIFSFFLVFGLLFSQTILAVGPFPPGTEDNPQCLPSDADCDVIPALISGDNITELVNNAGYLTAEVDSVFTASAANDIASGDITNWNTAYGWGDHASAGYLTSYVETDPMFSASASSGIASGDITNWNTAYGWGDHASAGYESTLTFNSGLSRSVNTITNDLITGLSGGQTVIGGILASESLTLSSTSNATKGKIIFGTSAYDEANNRLGIGTSTPVSSLEVTSTGTTGIVSNVANSGTSISSISGFQINNTDATAENWSGITFGDTLGLSSPTGGIGVQMLNRTNHYGDLAFATRSALGYTEKMRITSLGRVGIGTSTPQQKLEVKDGSIYLSDIDVSHGMTSVLPSNVFGSFASSTFTAGGLDIKGLSSTDATGLFLTGIIGLYDPADTMPAIIFSAAKKDNSTIQNLDPLETAFQFRNNNTSIVTILGSGNVGIGKISPATALDVNGIVTATSFNGSVTGNADTATKLLNARTIFGISFDGSANIGSALGTGAYATIAN